MEPTQRRQQWTLSMRMDLTPMENISKHGGPTANPVEEFAQAVQEVLAAAEETCGTEDLEPGLERALATLKKNPESRIEFENKILSLIESPQEGVVETVSFLMHELRWKAIREAIEKRVDSRRGDGSDIRLFEAMLDAFSDAWRDLDLYKRFS